MPKKLVNVNISDDDRQKLVSAFHNKRGTEIHVSRGGPIPIVLKASDQKRLSKAVRGKIKIKLTKKDVQDSIMSGEGFFGDLLSGIKSIARPVASVARAFSPILSPAIQAFGASRGIDPNVTDLGLNLTDGLLQQVGIGLQDPSISVAKRRKARNDLEKIGGALYGNALYSSQRGGCGCGSALRL